MKDKSVIIFVGLSNLIFCLTNHTHIDIMMIDIRRMLDPRLLGKISLASVFYFYNIL